MRFRNVHERVIATTPAQLGRVLDTLASPKDELWPWESWPAQRFDRPLTVGAIGGHGPIRYVVEAYEPGRLVRYRMDEACGLGGRHWFEVSDDERGALIRHVIAGEAGLVGWLRWQLLIRWLHDDLVEDAFDKAERGLTGLTARPRQWSRFVRSWRWLFAVLNRRRATTERTASPADATPDRS